jgi:chromosome segregation ATPase
MKEKKTQLDKKKTTAQTPGGRASSAQMKRQRTEEKEQEEGEVSSGTEGDEIDEVDELDEKVFEDNARLHDANDALEERLADLTAEHTRLTQEHTNLTLHTAECTKRLVDAVQELEQYRLGYAKPTLQRELEELRQRYEEDRQEAASANQASQFAHEAQLERVRAEVSEACQTERTKRAACDRQLIKDRQALQDCHKEVNSWRTRFNVELDKLRRARASMVAPSA